MTNPSRDRGTSWESKIVGYLKGCGHHYAERRARTGSKDQGDITGVDPLLVIEAKCTRSLDVAAMVNEAEAEAANVGPDALGVAWAHRRGKSSPGDGYVIMTGSTFLQFLAAWCGR